MLLCTTIGLTIAWPMLRLSQARCAQSIRRTLLDLAVLVALVQVVVWPLRLVTPWSVARTLAVDGTLVAWTALAGAIVAVGSRFRARGRTLTMASILALVLAVPLVEHVGRELLRPTSHGAASDEDDAAEWPVAAAFTRLSPVTAIHALTGGGPARPESTDRISLATAAFAAFVAWIAVGLGELARLIVPSSAGRLDGAPGGATSG